MNIFLLFLLFLPIQTQAIPVRTQNINDICSTKTDIIRNVSESLKQKIYIRDNVPGGNHTGICSGTEGCEVDHRISLELGGTNDISNLMIQPYQGTCNAHQKDKLENLLHKMICNSTISITEAQDLIYNDWVVGYKKYIDSKGCN